MCNKFKKPPGNTGPANDFILHCQRVHLKILKKNEASLMGGESSGDEEDSDGDAEGVDENANENNMNMDWLSDSDSVDEDAVSVPA